jgi:hypothetical protein
MKRFKGIVRILQVAQIAAAVIVGIMMVKAVTLLVSALK